ncbi:MAG: hypothetical protein HRT71_05790 [Flavobacteriales bacterium]|nr:hypothetical protein [Flavobacteriales bacterium]
MYKTQGNKGLFDEEFSKERLSTIGNPLESISKVIDFEIFRESLENKLLNTNKKNNAGAKPYDVLMLFKILRPLQGVYFNNFGQTMHLITY